MQKKEITKLQSNYRWEKTTGRKRQEDNIEGKQENEPNVKRILGIYHKGKLQKDAEERNNKITVELQMRKDNRKKETRRQYRRKARKWTKCKKNTRDIPQREITKGDY